MSENQQVSSSGITTQIESPEPWQRIIKVEITRDFFDKEYRSRLSKAVKGHSKPGFRKGHTPRAVVEKEVGQMIRMDTVEALIPKAWVAGIMEHKLAPITDPALENLDLGEEGPLKFDLKLEVRPEVELASYDGFPVKKREVAVKDEEIDAVLERLRQTKASFAPVDRPAVSGDQIKMDLTPESADDGPEGGRKIEDQQLVLGAESNMPAFNEALVGTKAGDTRTIEVVYPEDHPSMGLKGRTLSFLCEIKEIAAKDLPELDDAFAASFEEGKTLVALKDEVRANLTKEAERRIGQELDTQIQAELVRRNNVPVPPSMVSLSFSP